MKRRQEGRGNKVGRCVLEIKPAIKPEERHRIQDCLKDMGYHISGGGTDVDMSSCDISFYREPAYPCNVGDE